MKKYFQKTINDCMPAVIATMLQIDPDIIPHFIIFEGWKKFYGNWLLENHNSYFITIDKNEVTAYLSKDKYYCIGILHKNERLYTHAVILECIQFDNDNGKYVEYSIWHDPLGSLSDYDISDLIEIEILFKFADKLN